MNLEKFHLKRGKIGVFAPMRPKNGPTRTKKGWLKHSDFEQKHLLLFGLKKSRPSVNQFVGEDGVANLGPLTPFVDLFRKVASPTLYWWYWLWSMRWTWGGWWWDPKVTFVASLLQETRKYNRIKNQDTNRTFDHLEFCSRISLGWRSLRSSSNQLSLRSSTSQTTDQRNWLLLT